MPVDLAALTFAAASLIARMHGDGDLADGISDVRDIASAIRRTPTYAKVMKNAETVCRRELKREGGRLEDGDISAACIALSPIVRGATTQLDTVTLASDSSLLRTWLHTHGGAEARTGLLSAPAQAAYDVLLRAVTAYVAEVALQNPAFTTKGLQRVLQQNSEMLAVLKSLELQGKRRVVDSGRGFDAFTRAYLSRVREQLDFVDLPGIDLERTRSRYRLTSSYTPLRLEDTKQQKRPARQVGSVRLDDGSIVEFRPKEDAYVHFGDSDFDELTAPGRSILIVGDPGAGKSTLLKWLAVETATRGLLQVAGRPRIPILVKLRRATLPLRLKRLAEAFAVGMIEEKPDDWEKSLLKTGEAIVLVDGLDEIPADEREAVGRFLADLRQKYKQVTIIAASRPAAVTDPRHQIAVDHRLRLEPMNSTAVTRFTREWHLTVLQREGIDAEECLVIADQFTAKLESSSQLMRLATNPLLCAVMCALYHRRGHTLPGERVDLYNALLSLLLSRRDDERSVPPQLGAVTYAVKERILEGLASEFQLRQSDELPKVEVVGWLGRRSQQFGNADVRAIRPGLLLQFLVERVGLIRELPDGAIDFWHKSFQEFLCARAVINDAREDDLLEHVMDPAWLEVIRWAAGLLPFDRASRLLAGMIEDDSPPARAERYELALSCLPQVVELSPRVRDALEQHARRLVPPRDAYERVRVQRLGDVMIPYLESEILVAKSEVHRAACLSALVNIGGEAANTAIARCLDVATPIHARLLVDGWKVLGSADYANRVLSGLPPGCGTVRVTSPSQLRMLPKLKHLGRIEVSLLAPSPPVTDRVEVDVDLLELVGWSWDQIATFCGHFSTIEELRVVNPRPTRVKDWPRLENVSHVVWEWTPGVDDQFQGSRDFSTWESLAEVLPRCAGVENWTVRGIGFLGDVDMDVLDVPATVRSLAIDCEDAPALQGLGLEALVIANCENESFDLRGLPVLERLEILDCNGLVALPDMRHLRMLQHVSLTRCDLLRRVPVGRLPPSLDTLSITSCDDLRMISGVNDRWFSVSPYDQVDSPGLGTGGTPWEVWTRDELADLAEEFGESLRPDAPEIYARIGEMQDSFLGQFIDDANRLYDDPDTGLTDSGAGYLIQRPSEGRLFRSLPHPRLDELDGDFLDF